MKHTLVRQIIWTLAVMLMSSVALASDKYLLNAGDVLDVSVWKEDTLLKTVVILPDGKISFPLAGELQAEGKTVSELELSLKKSLMEFLAEPLVTVVVSQVSGNTVHILGKVQTPGSFVMNQSLDVMQALSLAGGLSPYAEENNIIVLRRKGNKQEVLPVHYAEIKEGNDLETNIILHTGDVIIIP